MKAKVEIISSNGTYLVEDISEFESAAIVVGQICAAIQVTCLFAKQLGRVNTSPTYKCDVFTLHAQPENTLS